MYSVDIETTGLDCDQHQILSIAVVRFNENMTLDEYQYLVRPRDFEQLRGHPIALAMNHEVLRLLGEIENQPEREEIGGYTVIDYDRVAATMRLFMDEPWVGSGFDRFDRHFLETYDCVLPRRVADVGSRYLLPKDEKVPGLDTCCERAGVVIENRHKAIDDAIATAQCFIKSWR